MKNRVIVTHFTTKIIRTYLYIPCYGPFSLGARFETYEPFISLIFENIFCSGRGEPRILNQRIRGPNCIELKLVSTYKAIRCHNPGDHSRNSRRRESMNIYTREGLV
jgi:hypothetical protein